MGIDDSLNLLYSNADKKRDYLREKKRESRLRRLEEGLCVECGAEKHMEGRKICKTCSFKAQERVRRKRELDALYLKNIKK